MIDLWKDDYLIVYMKIWGKFIDLLLRMFFYLIFINLFLLFWVCLWKNFGRRID